MDWSLAHTNMVSRKELILKQPLQAIGIKGNINSPETVFVLILPLIPSYMQRSITKNQLLQFIYSESSEIDSDRIKEALHVDSYLNDTYKELKTAIQRLPRIRKNPANQTLQRILTYSRKEKIRDTTL